MAEGDAARYGQRVELLQPDVTAGKRCPPARPGERARAWRGAAALSPGNGGRAGAPVRGGARGAPAPRAPRAGRKVTATAQRPGASSPLG